MRLMILENRRLRNSLRTDGGTLTIGSDVTCNIHLPDPRLGKHQANITRDDAGEWWLEVLDYSVPTCLNRAIQRSRAKLHHADEIECGPFSLRFFIESEQSKEVQQQERMAALLRSHGDSLPLGTIILKEDEGLAVTSDELTRITQLALQLCRCESVGDMLPVVLRAAVSRFNARRAWIGLRKVEKDDFDWLLGQTAVGKPIDRPHFCELAESRCIRQGHHLCTPDVPQDGIGSAMAVPLVGSKFTLGMLYVENDPADPPYDEQALLAFRAMACGAAVPIDAMIRQILEVRRAALNTELAMARSTQDALTPTVLPRWDSMQVAAYRLMGTETCCDLYDIMQLRDKTAALLVVKLHFPLHEIPCKLGEIRAAFRSAVLYGEAPHLFARALNWLLHDGDKGTFVDVAVARVWPDSGKVELCTAGRRVIVARVHENGRAERIESDVGPPVGQSRGAVYAMHSFELADGDSLVLASDGVESAKNAAGEVFGVRGLCDAVSDGLGDTPGHVLKEFASDLGEFLDGGANPQDISVVLLRRM